MADRGTPVDARYYEVAKPASFAEKVLIRARDRIYADFLRICSPAPTASIVDVGVSDVLTDGANVLERSYPYPEQITACGLGTAEEFQAAFPNVRYQRVASGAALPFEDKAFDIASSNAVLEHVGSRDGQARFVGELARVAKRVFITVPHRFFPVEHHTGIPLAHWTDATWRVACALAGKERWAREEELILMTARGLASVVPPGLNFEVGYTGLRLGPLSSNLYLAIHSATAAAS